MANIPESTKSEHVSWTVNATSYLRNLDSEDLDAETIAVHYQKAPEKTETGTRISLCFPTLIVSGYCSEPREVADRVARILNAHWDEPAAPPAMDREAVETAIRIGVWNACADRGMSQETATAIVQAVVAQPIVTKALSTLSADAIRQGEGWHPIETAVLWDVYIVTDGTNAAMAQYAESDYGDRYWAVEPEDALEWEPTHCIATPASHASDGGKA